MFSIEEILSEEYSKYPQEVQDYMIRFNESLRENIKKELINDKADKIMKDIDKSKEYLIEVLEDILEKGCKGYNSMSTRALLNVYLSDKGQEDFIRLIEKVSNEIE